jgi:acyl-coenzyme A thioesterase PaaI-like protein
MTPATRPTISQMWSKAQGWPMGNKIFSFLVGRQARYTGTIGATVVEVDERRSVVQMRDRAAVRNHLNSVHAVALMNLGELCTGLAVMYQVDGRGRGIVRNLGMEYIKKARGTITATCEADIPKEPGEHDYIAEGFLRDEGGQVVAKCTATWRIDIRE